MTQQLQLRFAIYAFCKTPHLPLRGILSRKGRGGALRLRFAKYGAFDSGFLLLFNQFTKRRFYET
ncbi:MAG: hypothetical protein LBT79_04505 [Elusimicrobiota bacterium]|nr:hypothetical protein [Elusimicrobiota bacterium]